MAKSIAEMAAAASTRKKVAPRVSKVKPKVAKKKVTSKTGIVTGGTTLKKTKVNPVLTEAQEKEAKRLLKAEKERRDAIAKAAKIAEQKLQDARDKAKRDSMLKANKRKK